MSALDLDQVREWCRAAQAPGVRGSFVIRVVLPQNERKAPRRIRLNVGGAVLDGKVVGTLGGLAEVRFFVDEVRRELQRRGLAGPAKAGEGA